MAWSAGLDLGELAANANPEAASRLTAVARLEATVIRHLPPSICRPADRPIAAGGTEHEPFSTRVGRDARCAGQRQQSSSNLRHGKPRTRIWQDVHEECLRSKVYDDGGRMTIAPRSRNRSYIVFYIISSGLDCIDWLKRTYLAI